MITNLELDLISPPEIDTRSYCSESELKELSESIKSVGLIEPIVVRKRNERYEIVAGHRRYLACRLLNWVKLPVIVKVLTDEETLSIRIHENLHRENLTPLDESNFVAALHYEYKIPLPDVAVRCSKSRGWVKDRIDLFHLPDHFKKAVHEKAIKPTVALTLCEITNIPYRDELLTRAGFSGLTVAQAKLWVTDWKRIEINSDFEPEVYKDPEQRPYVVGEHLQCKICDVDVILGNYAHLLVCPECQMRILASKQQMKEPACDHTG